MSVSSIILDVQSNAFSESVLVFDSLTEVGEQYSSSLSSHPLSDGENVSDHVTKSNPTITYKGLIQNFPIPNVMGNTLPDNKVNDSGNANRVQQAYNILYTLWNKSTPFTLVSKYQVFTNCVITSLNFPRQANNANILTVNMTVEKARVANFQTFIAVQIDTAKKVSTGSAGKEEGDEEKGEVSIVTVFSDLVDFFTGADLPSDEEVKKKIREQTNGE